MRNVIVLGSGRSGTSMVTGLLAGAGYFMGKQLAPAYQGNPKGIFEDREINGLNEAILYRVMPQRPRRPYVKPFFMHRPIFMQRWLGILPVGTPVAAQPEEVQRIRALTAKTPFCFKDPRFSYTLPVWRPFLEDTVFICVFRNPVATVESILRECRNEPYLQDFRITRRRAFKVWLHMYEHILRMHRHEGAWLFLHFDQVLTEAGMARLEAFTEAPVDRSFPERRLKRSTPGAIKDAKVQDIYDALCKLAGYVD